jgi:hypothetical protein
MNTKPTNRDLGIEKVRKQFEDGGPITQSELDEMVNRRRLAGVKEEVIQQFIDSITVGESRFIFFVAYPEEFLDATQVTAKGPQTIRVLKKTVTSMEDAINQLDEFGKFIKQDEHLATPRLHAWR